MIYISQEITINPCDTVSMPQSLNTAYLSLPSPQNTTEIIDICQLYSEFLLDQNFILLLHVTLFFTTDISQETAINPYDIVSTLQSLSMLKYWKGKHLVLKRQDLIDEYLEGERKRAKGNKVIEPSSLKWTPPIVETLWGRGLVKFDIL